MSMLKIYNTAEPFPSHFLTGLGNQVKVSNTEGPEALPMKKAGLRVEETKS